MKNKKVTALVLVTSLAVVGCVDEEETVVNPPLPVLGALGQAPVKHHKQRIELNKMNVTTWFSIEVFRLGVC